jgi:hypothetical protein
LLIKRCESLNHFLLCDHPIAISIDRRKNLAKIKNSE